MVSSNEEKKEEKTTEADKIWNEIKDQGIEIYALPDQTVGQHLTKVNIPGDKLFVKPKSPAVVPALESVLGNAFTLEQSDKGYLIISRSVADPLDEEDEYIKFPRANGKVDKISKKKFYNS